MNLYPVPIRKVVTKYISTGVCMSSDRCISPIASDIFCFIFFRKRLTKVQTVFLEKFINWLRHIISQNSHTTYNKQKTISKKMTVEIGRGKQIKNTMQLFYSFLASLRVTKLVINTVLFSLSRLEKDVAVHYYLL